MSRRSRLTPRTSLRPALVWGLAAMLMALPASVLALPAGITTHLEPAQRQGRALRLGDKGAPVADLQRLLTGAGFDPGRIDGIFGPLTEAAVRAAQRDLALAQDGLAGTLTLAALQEAQGRSHPGQGVREAGASLVVYHAASPAQTGAPSLPAVAAPAAPPGQRAPLAITFNGRPDPALLPGLLDRLERHSMKATFFIRGADAEEQPALVAAIAAAGHEVGNNGQTDRDMSRMSEVMVQAQLARAQQVIAEVSGQQPRFFRPPQGAFSARLLEAVGSMGLNPVLWTNIMVRDEPGVPSALLQVRLLEGAHPGAVLMLHQDRPDAVELLEGLLRDLQADGYRSVTLSELQQHR